jgi:competence protein ComEC
VEIALILLAFLLWPISLTMPLDSRWIIWNVGQGEWVTWVTHDRCYHFDMGGERMPDIRVCADKQNRVYFTHWDLDHIGFAAKAQAVLPHICLGQAPLGEASRRKQKLLAHLKPCAPDPIVRIWKPFPPRKKGKQSANELCQIYVVNGKMLVTGDAPMAEERQALFSGWRPGPIRWLVLGHHGSRTSTSDTLLDALPELRLAIATARHKKYGHPHPETIERLNRHHIPLLTTEEWGNIVIED